jgi:hypothetical protein
MRGQQVKIMKIMTKISGNIAAVAFVTKKSFLCRPVMFFFLQLYLEYSPIAAVLC